NAVDRIGMQIVRNELVVAFELQIGDVEKNRTVFFFRALPQDVDGTPVPFEQWRHDGGYERLLQNLRERMVREQRNQPLYEGTVTGGFDRHGQLQGRSFHFHRRLGVVIHGSIHDVGPIDQLRHRARIEAEVLFRYHRNKTCARLESGIVELVVALLLIKMGGIGGGKKSAFVVIEPPGDVGRTGILEIDDGILVAVELFLVEQSARAMQQAGVYELHVAAHSFLIKTGEQGCRTCPVKTLVVIKHAHSQNCLPYLFLRVCSEKQLELLVWRIMSRRNWPLC